MKLHNLIMLIKSDLSRFEQTFAQKGQQYSKKKVFWESMLFKAGFHAVLFYRISHWLFLKRCTYLAWFMTRLNIALTGAEIEFNAEIGQGLFIAHPVGIIIGRGAVIGSNATIFQGVSFVVNSWHPDSITKFPKAGDNCFFFANSTILGDVVIGNNCIVAAHALVNQSMPDGSLARGVPAKIYPDEGKEKIDSWFKNES